MQLESIEHGYLMIYKTLKKYQVSSVGWALVTIEVTSFMLLEKASHANVDNIVKLYSFQKSRFFIHNRCENATEVIHMENTPLWYKGLRPIYTVRQWLQLQLKKVIGYTTIYGSVHIVQQ